MNSNLIIATLLFFSIVSKVGQVFGAEWNYDTDGPDAWPHEIFTCGGLHQSPIDIKPTTAIYDPHLKPFELINYDSSYTYNVTHNGRTVLVSRIIDDPLSANVSVFGSDLKQKYDLTQFHFHWGNNNYQGSEHTVDMEKHPVEVHFVHQSSSGGLLVMSFLFEIVEANNSNIEPLLEAVEKAKDQLSWELVPLNLSSIITNTSLYYRYYGSLSTPPCTEGVIWNVFQETIKISSFQIELFRHNTIKINFRDIQRMNDRILYSSVCLYECSDSSYVNLLILAIVSLIVLVIILVIMIVILIAFILIVKHLFSLATHHQNKKYEPLLSFYKTDEKYIKS